jgi:hypothetical protein
MLDGGAPCAMWRSMLQRSTRCCNAALSLYCSTHSGRSVPPLLRQLAALHTLILDNNLLSERSALKPGCLNTASTTRVYSTACMRMQGAAAVPPASHDFLVE